MDEVGGRRRWGSWGLRKVKLARFSVLCAHRANFTVPVQVGWAFIMLDNIFKTRLQCQAVPRPQNIIITVVTITLTAKYPPIHPQARAHHTAPKPK